MDWFEQLTENTSGERSKHVDWPFADLLSVSTMTLATRGEVDIHTAPVFFVADAHLCLYFFSEEKSLHGQHILQTRQVAAAIYPQCTGWQDIRGLQIHGKVRKVEQREEWDLAWNLYLRKFPFVKSLKAIVRKNQLFVLMPEWIRLVDNTKRFGYKEEWNLPKV